MENEKILVELFREKVDEGGVISWCKKSESYNKYKKNFDKYQKELINLVNKRLIDNELKNFKELLEELKGTIYDYEFKEKEYYFKEGCKYGIELMKELFE